MSRDASSQRREHHMSFLDNAKDMADKAQDMAADHIDKGADVAKGAIDKLERD
jgi:hypothetical protein